MRAFTAGKKYRVTIKHGGFNLNVAPYQGLICPDLSCLNILIVHHATYVALSVGCLFGRLCSPHFLQLCSQSSRYFSSFWRTNSAAFAHNSLGSVQPVSLQSLAMKMHHSWTSCFSSTALFVRISRQSSRANTHVLT